jgi:hypothetical protein
MLVAPNQRCSALTSLTEKQLSCHVAETFRDIFILEVNDVATSIFIDESSLIPSSFDSVEEIGYNPRQRLGFEKAGTTPR